MYMSFYPTTSLCISTFISLPLPVCVLVCLLFSLNIFSSLITKHQINHFACRGSLDVKMAPKAVTLREETELQAMLDRLALDQEDVDGDEPEDN